MHLSVQFIRSRDSLSAEGRDVEKFGLSSAGVEISRAEPTAKNAAAG